MNVWIVDLLAQTPFYDRDLAQSVAPLVDHLTLYSTRFRLEPEYFEDVVFERSHGLSDRLTGASIKPQSLRRAGRMVEYALNLLYLASRATRRTPDILHVQWLPLLSWSTWELQMIRLFQRRHIPAVYTVHNYMPHEMSSRSRKRYLQAYAMMDHIVVHTMADKEKLRSDLGSAARVSVIPQGPSLTHRPLPDRSCARTALDIEDEEVVFLMLGVIRPYKCIENAVQALAKVSKSHRCKLMVGGTVLDQAYLHRLQKLADQLGIADLVDWRPGYTHSSKVGLFYAAADVVVFPYREISQSAAFLTAAGFGKCTLTTRVGGLAELSEDNVTTVQITQPDPEMLAEGMARCIVLSHAGRAEIGQRLQAHVNDCCSWKLVAQRTYGMYQQVLDRQEN